MNVIVVLDDQNGMRFNHRRQSRDRNLTAQILMLCGGKLVVNPDTAELFEGTNAELTISSSPLLATGKGEWCFVEDCLPESACNEIEQLVVFRWNRLYPADQWLELDLSSMHLCSKTDFVGFSHEKITKEVYLP